MHRVSQIALRLALACAAASPWGAAAEPLGAREAPRSGRRPAAQEVGPESRRVQIAGGFSVCLPLETRPLNRRDGAGLECKTAEGAYYAYHFSPRHGNVLPTFFPARGQSPIVSESQLEAASNAMLNAQVALLGQAKNNAILHEEHIRVGVYYGRRITYRTQADYGDGIVNAYTVIVALAPQGKICQFTFVPSILFAAQADAFAKAYFDSIRPTVRQCSKAR